MNQGSVLLTQVVSFANPFDCNVSLVRLSLQAANARRFRKSRSASDVLCQPVAMHVDGDHITTFRASLSITSLPICILKEGETRGFEQSRTLAVITA